MPAPLYSDTLGRQETEQEMKRGHDDMGDGFEGDEEWHDFEDASIKHHNEWQSHAKKARNLRRKIEDLQEEEDEIIRNLNEIAFKKRKLQEDLDTAMADADINKGRYEDDCGVSSLLKGQAAGDLSFTKDAGNQN